MTFSNKQITFKFTLAQGNFQSQPGTGKTAFTGISGAETTSGKEGAGGTTNLQQINLSNTSSTTTDSNNTLTVTGLRSTAQIVKPGLAGKCSMQASIYGLTQSHMNQLNTYGQTINAYGRNYVVVTVGEKGQQGSVVFDGLIVTAWQDAMAMPDVAFRIEAFMGLEEAVAAATPTSIPNNNNQGIDVATTMESIVKKMPGVTFKNNGVNKKLASVYLPGSAYNQAKALAKMAGIEMILDNKVLSIWQPGQPGSTDASVVISPTTGMVGYPGFTSYGIAVRTLFNPQLQYKSQFTVKDSKITPANGDWICYALEYDLSAEFPHGPWFQLVSGAKAGQVPVTATGSPTA